MIFEFSADDFWTDERRDEARDKIESLQRNGRGLTRREHDFVDSIEGQLADRRFLTSKQESWLDSLCDTKLS